MNRDWICSKCKHRFTMHDFKSKNGECDSCHHGLEEDYNIYVTSSHGQFTVDTNGKVLDWSPNSDDTKHIAELAKINQFNLAECDAFWGWTDHQRVYDILDLGGSRSDGTCFAPCYEARNDMMINKPAWLSIETKFGKGQI